MIVFLVPVAFADQQSDNRSPVVLNETIWVTFYDLPSRRFRAIRTAILARDKWSNVAVTREVHAKLEGLREVASQVRNPETSARAYREKPVVRTEQLLRRIGKHFNRRISFPVAQKDIAVPDAARSES